jgi:hypothetical protein
MTLPLLPVIYDDGYDFIEQLQRGWYVVPAWGSEGWNAGTWPLVILVHYDGGAEVPYGMAVHTEGDIDLKEFQTREERDRATDEWAGCLVVDVQ